MKTIYLNSADSYTPTTPHDCNWVFNLSSVDSYSKIALQNVVIPHLRYPVNSSTNKLVFQENGFPTLITAVLNDGNYTGSSLASEIKRAMEEVGTNTYAVSYNSTTQKLSISVANPDQLKLHSSSTCQRVTGLDFDEVNFKYDIVGKYVVRLDGTQFLDVLLNIPTNNLNSSRRQIYSRIPMNISFGSVLTWTNPIQDWSPFMSKEIKSLEIRLLDDRGKPFILPDNAEVQYTLKLEN